MGDLEDLWGTFYQEHQDDLPDEWRILCDHVMQMGRVPPRIEWHVLVWAPKLEVYSLAFHSRDRARAHAKRIPGAIQYALEMRLAFHSVVETQAVETPVAACFRALGFGQGDFAQMSDAEALSAVALRIQAKGEL